MYRVTDAKIARPNLLAIYLATLCFYFSFWLWRIYKCARCIISSIWSGLLRYLNGVLNTLKVAMLGSCIDSYSNADLLAYSTWRMTWSMNLGPPAKTASKSLYSTLKFSTSWANIVKSQLTANIMQSFIPLFVTKADRPSSSILSSIRLRSGMRDCSKLWVK